jgi:hypothetical protein
MPQCVIVVRVIAGWTPRPEGRLGPALPARGRRETSRRFSLKGELNVQSLESRCSTRSRQCGAGTSWRRRWDYSGCALALRAVAFGDVLRRLRQLVEPGVSMTVGSNPVPDPPLHKSPATTTILAEKVGFEPTVPVRGRRFSSPRIIKSLGQNPKEYNAHNNGQHWRFLWAVSQICPECPKKSPGRAGAQRDFCGVGQPAAALRLMALSIAIFRPRAASSISAWSISGSGCSRARTSRPCSW